MVAKIRVLPDLVMLGVILILIIIISFIFVVKEVFRVGNILSIDFISTTEIPG